jgi:hypothetical protein
VIGLFCYEDYHAYKVSICFNVEDLTIARKRINAFRWKYQRTKTNNNLRDQRKIEYYEEKAQYQTKIKNAKIQLWRQYCNMTSSTNPWNIVYISGTYGNGRRWGLYHRRNKANNKQHTPLKGTRRRRHHKQNSNVDL